VERQRAHEHGSQKAFLCQNAPLPASRGVAEEEQESSIASGKPRRSRKHVLWQRLPRTTGQPGASPALKVSPDGAKLASGGDDEAIML